MPSSIKMRMVAELATRFREMPHAVLVDCGRLSAGQADELRAALGEQGAGMLVVKNSLAILALRQLERLRVARLIGGPTAFIHGGEDPALLARTVLDWGRKEKLLALRGAMIGEAALDPAEAQALASLPPLPVLRGMVVGAIAAPLTAFLGVLQAVPASFARALKAIAERDGGTDADPS